MSFSISSLVRLIVLTALVATMLAIGLSRIDPPRTASRTRVPAQYYHINEYYLNVSDRVPRWLDSETGRVEAPSLEDGDVLEAASCAPWFDERGRRQVAGRWADRTKMGPSSLVKDFGLARYSFPDGRMLDHVSTATVPVGPPCWFAGSRARILFVSGDGELYHYAFEPDPPVKPGPCRSARDVEPIRVAWRCPKPGLGEVFLGDLSWPEDPRMSGYVIVALRVKAAGPNGPTCFSHANLYWLKLDEAGSEILEAGRLLVPANGVKEDDPSSHHRMPSVGTLRDGRLALAYLAGTEPNRGWELRASSIEFEGAHRVPRALESDSVALASRCQPSTPVFSSDGRWLHAVSDSYGEGDKILRVSVEGRLGRGD